jgi:PepSY-associated TM region
MLRALILLHRWLGVACCLLIAMWFASGIVMHFVPFPSLTEVERFVGRVPIDPASVEHSPAEAIAASGIGKVTRVQLLQRSDGAVYLIADDTHLAARRAADLSDATVRSPQLALAIATDHARRRGWSVAAASVAAEFHDDQWTVTGNFDRHRPLYRVALNDKLGTELYVSSATGEIVLDTTRYERGWNAVGSVAHWIYPTALRRHPAAWSRLLWWLSLAALVGATAGAVVGTLRIGAEGSRGLSPYRGLQALHHWLGLGSMLFVVSWIFSGWLSLGDGLLFSTGKPSIAEVAWITGAPDWNALPDDQLRRVAPPVTEVEWFVFGGKIYRRERTALDQQRLSLTTTEDTAANSNRAFLRADEIDAATRLLERRCAAALRVETTDAYAMVSVMPGAPVYRTVCGDDWFTVDGADGAVLEKLDGSRRAYRWLFAGLHTLDVPALRARPALRTALIVVLCGCGFAFSLTGIVIAYRRVRSYCSS